MRGGDASQHAVRSHQERRPAGDPDAPSHAVGPDQEPDGANQSDPGTLGRIRDSSSQVREEGFGRAAGSPGNRGRSPVPLLARESFTELRSQLLDLEKRIKEQDARIARHFAAHPVGKTLMEIPGIGILTATTLLLALSDPKAFRNGCHFSAWTGLLPRQHSSGGKNVLLGTSKRGDPELRALLIHKGMICHENLRPPETPHKAHPMGSGSGRASKVQYHLCGGGEQECPHRLVPVGQGGSLSSIGLREGRTTEDRGSQERTRGHFKGTENIIRDHISRA